MNKISFALFLMCAVMCAIVLMAQQPARRPAASATEAAYQASADSAERKFAYLEQNGEKAQPDPRPTELTDREINAYLNSGRVKLPAGVSNPQLTASNNSQLNATVRVDFDQVTGERESMNPLMRLFSGTHDVAANAQAVGIQGEGRVHINSVAIDGINVPHAALEYFVENYIAPKYPNVGLDSRFQLPARIASAVVGDHKVTLTQK
jgi:hypothetical protein